MRDYQVIAGEAENIKNYPQDVYSKIVQMQELTLEVLLDIREALIHPLYINGNADTISTERIKKVLDECLICSRDHLTKDCPSLEEKIGGNAKSHKNSVPVPFTPIVSSVDFHKIKDLKNQDKTAVDASNELDFPLQQVNFAFQARDYEDYVRLAKRAK